METSKVLNISINIVTFPLNNPVHAEFYQSISTDLQDRVRSGFSHVSEKYKYTLSIKHNDANDASIHDLTLLIYSKREITQIDEISLQAFDRSKITVKTFPSDVPLIPSKTRHLRSAIVTCVSDVLQEMVLFKITETGNDDVLVKDQGKCITQ